MLVSDFSYILPDGLIARYPAEERDSSRLMMLDRATGSISETIFSNFPDYLREGDLLVLNDTKVIPARLSGYKESGGKVELFLLEKLSIPGEQWHCLVRSSKRFKEGQTVILPDDMIATMVIKDDSERWRVSFSGNESFGEWLEREGHIPLPPYLQRSDEVSDRGRYQTVYAKNSGAVAAPTAGLHLTEIVLKKVKSKGVKVAYLTLHTGLGTFLPVRVTKVQEHQIHKERFTLSEETATMVNETKSCGKRVLAVGTTTARTLEFSSDQSGFVTPGQGEADIFIYPGYDFKVVDALLTNFHLPESTLLMLVSAFAGRESILDAYRQAINSKFRFYSYGDAMLIA